MNKTTTGLGANTVTLVVLLMASLGPRAAVAADRPDTTGPWFVGHRQLASADASRGDRPLPLEVWYPVDAADARRTPFTHYVLMGPLGITSDLAHEGVPISAAGVRPLVVFSHGSGGLAIQSIRLMEHLASHGFVVVAPNHTGNTTADLTGGTAVPIVQALLDRVPDISFVIDHMTALSATPGDPFFGRVDGQNVGVVGHSLGGFTALAVKSGYQGIPPDARVRAIMPIAPAANAISDGELSGIMVPTLFMTGTNDGLLAQEIRAAGLIHADPFNYRADVIGATHTHFANICDIANALITAGLGPGSWPAIGAAALVDPYNQTCIPPAFSIEEATRIQNLYAAAFFRRHLLGERFYDEFLVTGYAEAYEPAVMFVRSAGLCEDGECGLCETCDPQAGCVARPATGCRRPTASGKSTLRISNAVEDRHDRVVWRWNEGEMTTMADYGDPTSTLDYALCVYDQGSGGAPRLVMRNHIPAGGVCNGQPCWKARSPAQLEYRSHFSTRAGVKWATLVAGVDGEARIMVRGKGPNLHLAPLPPLTPKVTVQLQGESGLCWEAEYSAPVRNDGISLNARSD
jgi:predicted dienelactone hydrolase